ncbi:caspase activity and apoptosis inhibitor 1-like isoform X2 [Haliotis rufescens]|uniref:caspase activity and apoptosis inhibitor 1-like isoform X2 n=1 Tax=Haliotis rufescens TaxID=6454 RepID=UPI001EAF9EE7|nr:caspase activity and apoptosis inhibitor 1-like isoform X2 [Haliotis rufescens]
MSAAKMVADSTQSDEFATKSQHRNSGEKKAKKAKRSGKKAKKKKNTEEEDALLNDPDLDLNKEVKDIGDYIRDRQEMLNQMFNAVQGASLQRALPDVLKELPLDVLKQRCLEHMEVMSRKRIRRILHGDDPAAISSSGTDDETSNEGAADSVEEAAGQQAADSTSQTGEEQEGEDRDKTVGMKGLLVDEEQMDIEEESEGEWRTPPRDEGSDLEVDMEEQEDGEEEKVEEEDDIGEVEGSADVEGEGNSEDQEEDGEEVEEEVELASNKSKAISQSSRDPEDGKKMAEVAESLKHKMVAAEAGDTITPVLTKNQMELLELEMRARAIKAMLKKHQSKSTQ